jgi:uncharacterized RDD family membrane protein YckC
MADKQDIYYAGFWIRVLATALDLLLFLFIAVPFLYLIHGRAYFKSEVQERGLIDFLNVFVLPNLILPLLWCLWSSTPGKMAVSTKIVDAQTGRKPKARQFLLRFLGYYLSALPLGLGFLWVLVDRKKQAWHDKLAGTVVIRTRV